MQSDFPFENHPSYHDKEANYFKLVQADCHSLPFPSSHFDSVIDIFSLNSYYDSSSVLQEMYRVCKHDGLVLIIARGQSHLSLYNSYLKLRAAHDLLEHGYVEHIDIQNLIESMPGFQLIHKERKNLGMTYIYILRAIKSEDEGSNLSIKDRQKIKSQEKENE